MVQISLKSIVKLFAQNEVKKLVKVSNLHIILKHEHMVQGLRLWFQLLLRVGQMSLKSIAKRFA